MAKQRIVPELGDPFAWIDVPDIDELITPANVANLVAALPDSTSAGEIDSVFDRFGGPNFTSFSGCDIIVQAYSNGKLKKFAELQTISYSVHREKVPVRTLGRANPKGFTRGPRTIAGSLIFTVFDRSALWGLLPSWNRIDPPDLPGHTSMIDQIPPIDVTITFQNETGIMASMRLYGLELTNEGQTMSIDDIITENVMSYIARDMTIMAPSGQEFGPDGKVFVNQGIFFADEASEMNVALASALVRQIGAVRSQLALATGSNAAALSAQLADLNKSLELLSKNSYNIAPKEGALNKTGPYHTPWTYLDIRGG